MSDSQQSRDNWIPEAEYEQIQNRVPILCVDYLPVDDHVDAIGLIRRKTYDGNQGWCLVGGAVKRGESVVEALGRHIDSTLGRAVEYRPMSRNPLIVTEYFPEPRPGELFDPRKHAVALNFAGTLEGIAEPRDEALEFRWFDRDQLDRVEFGFGQGTVVKRLLSRLSEESEG